MSFRNGDNFDPYRELQLSPDAEPELIKAAFKALAKKYHPDQFSDPAEKARAEARMARINEAQRLLQSGEYRPPIRATQETAARVEPEPPPASSPPQPPPRTVKSSASPAHKKSEIRSSARLSSAAFILFALALLTVLILPTQLSQNHLERALSLEKQGLYQEALEELNSAVEQAPGNRELYAHRARIWDHLGFPERAEVDRTNSRPQTSRTPIAP